MYGKIKLLAKKSKLKIRGKKMKINRKNIIKNNMCEYFKEINEENINLYLKGFFVLSIIFLLIFIRPKFKREFKRMTIPNIAFRPRKNFTKISLDEAVNNFKKYLEICKNDSFINKEAFVKQEEPIISAIIPVYNSQETIKLAIRSIQNQDMKNIEIILVNDLADSNTTKIIEDLKKKDPRIKIIYNEKKLATLHSRCIGILAAKGRYIIFVDSDDMFCDKDVFDILYDETEAEKYEILSFLAFENFGNTYKDVLTTIKANKHIMTGHQPDIGIYPSSRNNPIYHNNVLIWGKMIKAEPFKEAVNKFGKERYSKDIKWSDDTTLFFMSCTTAQSYKYIEKYGIFHYVSHKSTTSSMKKSEKMFGEVFNLDTSFDFSKNEYKNFTIHKLLKMKSQDYFTLEDEKITEYFKSVIKKILNSKYIEEKYKSQIRKSYKHYNLIE